ncbi:P-type ATPase [Terrisporobacter petrolearius]|uniref:P-type ATPase n=1 Tax=Terrisporobacter petrolearius TaxID=1460447 RepID=UPI001D16D5DA|nr:hypothetical protein [Terrisporobacter petrolearius]
MYEVISDIESGNMIPADGRLVESQNLKLREGMLTGELAYVAKSAGISSAILFLLYI